MFKFFRRKKDTPLTEASQTRDSTTQSKSTFEQPESQPSQEDTSEQNTESTFTQAKSEPVVVEPTTKPTKNSWFSRLKTSLSKTRNHFSQGLAQLFLGKKEIDEELLNDIETQLIMADVGVETTQKIIERLTQKISRKELCDPMAVYRQLQLSLADILAVCQEPLVIDEAHKPYVILMIGVNGAGKTTTIGKLAKKFQQAGKTVMLAAGDTFRAAAVEQLQIWGERNQVPVVAQKPGADSASVIYDAFQSAKAKHIDVLIADTAGRLHTRDNLMEELKKVKRVIQKLDDKAPHEIMLVLDASMGQNALVQAIKFHEALAVSGITLTKLDGTAKGGIIFAIANQLGLPIRFIGIGEKVDDLRAFDAKEFAAAIFQVSNEESMDTQSEG